MRPSISPLILRLSLLVGLSGTAGLVTATALGGASIGETWLGLFGGLYVSGVSLGMLAQHRQADRKEANPSISR